MVQWLVCTYLVNGRFRIQPALFLRRSYTRHTGLEKLGDMAECYFVVSWYSAFVHSFFWCALLCNKFQTCKDNTSRISWKLRFGEVFRLFVFVFPMRHTWARFGSWKWGEAPSCCLAVTSSQRAWKVGVYLKQHLNIKSLIPRMLRDSRTSRFGVAIFPVFH